MMIRKYRITRVALLPLTLICASCEITTPGVDSPNANTDNTNTNDNGGGQAAADPFGFSLRVFRHVDQPLTNNEIDTVFAVASSQLQREDFECPDIACPVTFGRDGDVNTFSIGSAFITSETELDAVFDLEGDIKVLTSMVGVCGVPSSDDSAVILGCAFTGGSVVIVRDADPDVWAHEWGHVQGLNHRDSCPRNLMHSFELRTNAVTESECQAFLTPSPQAFSLPFRVSPEKVAVVDDLLEGQSVDYGIRRFDESRRQWLERLVAPRYIAGMPAGAIRHCNDDGVCQALSGLLNESTDANVRQNILRGMGLTDDPAAIDPLVAYLSSIEGELTIGEFRVASEALLALGRIASTGAEQYTLAVLQQAAVAQYWTDRGVHLDTGASTSEALSGVAVKALGISGVPAATDYLRLLQDNAQLADEHRRLARIAEAISRSENHGVRVGGRLDGRQP